MSLKKVQRYEVVNMVKRLDKQGYTIDQIVDLIPYSLFLFSGCENLKPDVPIEHQNFREPLRKLVEQMRAE